MTRLKKTALVLYWLAAPLVVGAVAQIVSSLPFTLTNGTVADATQVMADFNQIVNNVNANAAKNGVNNDITALTALSTPVTPSQGGTTVFIAAATGGGTANVQTVTTTIPTTFALTTNYSVVFVPGFTNTGATTLAVAGTAAKNVFKPSFSGPVTLTGGEVRAGQAASVIYDGTQYVLQVDTPYFGVETGIASATTTDLGTVASHVALISGTTTITSFGSSASTAAPFYMLRFSGVMTLTENGSSLLLPGAANITTAVADSAVAQYLGAGAWEIVSYTRTGGAPFSGVTIQTFVANGTYTPRAGMSYVVAECMGGGGSGAGGTGTVGTANSGGGGGAGAYSRVILTAAQIGASQAVTVGAGGTAPAAGNTIGNAGGASSLGALCSAAGGLGATAGSGNSPGQGGAGGNIASGVGTFVVNGAAGRPGGAASIITVALNGGQGANSFLGSGAQGGSIAAGTAATVTGSSAASTLYGGGGGGGATMNQNTTVAGGNGGTGFVLVTEF